jgi:hypothetical protein
MRNPIIKRGEPLESLPRTRNDKGGSICSRRSQTALKVAFSASSAVVAYNTVFRALRLSVWYSPSERVSASPTFPPGTAPDSPFRLNECIGLKSPFDSRVGQAYRAT